jgi:hypothetical protein
MQTPEVHKTLGRLHFPASSPYAFAVRFLARRMARISEAISSIGL